jgi:GNAT superfamily N-acetyltransferase
MCSYNFSMRGLTFSAATPADAEELATLRNSVAADQLQRFGVKSFNTTSRGILCDLRWGDLLIARRKNQIISSLVFVKKKPWAIDVTYFTSVEHPLYIRSMNTLPIFQHQGAGSRLIKYALTFARRNGNDAVRLDAHDAPYGAGDFYLKCGFAPRGGALFRNTPHLYFEYLL